MNLDPSEQVRLGPLVVVTIFFWYMLAMLGSILVIFAVEIGAETWVAANRSTFLGARAALCALLGAAAGRAAFTRLRREGDIDAGGSALMLSLWMGAALALGDWLGSVLPPILGMTARRPYAALPATITTLVGGIGTWLAFTRSGLRPAVAPLPSPVSTSMAPPVPLSKADLSVVRAGLAMLDREDARLARLWSGAMFPNAPTRDETNAVFAEFVPYFELCGRVPKEHAVRTPMLDAAVAYDTAMQLRFIARGWEDLLDIGPDAQDYVRQLAGRFKAPTNEAGQVADVAWREARHERNQVAEAAGLPTKHYPKSETGG